MFYFNLTYPDFLYLYLSYGLRLKKIFPILVLWVFLSGSGGYFFVFKIKQPVYNYLSPVNNILSPPPKQIRIT